MLLEYKLADSRLELRYIELDNLYQLSVIDTVMAVTKHQAAIN